MTKWKKIKERDTIPKDLKCYASNEPCNICEYRNDCLVLLVIKEVFEVEIENDTKMC